MNLGLWWVFFVTLNSMSQQIEVNVTQQWGFKSDGYATEEACQKDVDAWKLANNHTANKIFCKSMEQK